MLDELLRLKELKTVKDNIVVYTAIFGNVDKLSELDTVPGVRYVCFTDTCIESNTWEIQYVSPDKMQQTPRRTARWYKTHPYELFPEATCVIWIDARLSFKFPLHKYVEYLKKSDIVVTKHPLREGVYQEAETCKKLQLDKVSLIDTQIQRYHAEGYPVRSGLAETGCLITRPCKNTRKFFELWWNEIDTGSVRDQLSFNYVIWKLNLKYAVLDFNMINRGKHVHRHSPEAEKVVVVIPFAPGDTENMAKVKAIMEIRAGVPCEVIPVEDTEGIGWPALHNKMAKELAYSWYLYSCSDYFPSRGYLKTALEYAKKHHKKFVCFNDGKWAGENATAGLVHRSLIPKLYATGTLFHTGYKFHGADPDVTGRAKKLNQFIYAPEAILMEIDFEKDFKNSSRLNQADVVLYKRRKRLGFPP